MMPNADEGSTHATAKTPAVTDSTKPGEKAAAARAAGKPDAGAPGEKPPSSNLRRRIIWSCIWGYLAANFFMFLRFFFPRTLFEPSTVFHIGYPSDYALGVSDKLKQEARLWVVKEPTRLYCIYARCTHLGCTPDWKPAENKFKCPCHGSGYTPAGVNFEGPAPRPMDRAHVELDASGQIVVDTSRLYSWNKAQGGANQFEDPGAFISVS